MPAKVALLVAVGQFDDPGLTQLRAPATDAAALAGLLGDPDVGGYEVTVLQDPTIDRLNRALEAFYRDRRRDDVLLVYFSCHGVKDEGGNLYLSAKDTRLDLLRSTALAATWLHSLIDDSLSRSKLLLLDCCFSGAFSRGKLQRSPALSTVDVKERFQGTGTVVLTASNETEYAFEDAEVRAARPTSSYFTRALIEGLETGAADENRDGWVSIDELYNFVFDKVRERNPNQHPTGDINVQGTLRIAKVPSLAGRKTSELNLSRVTEYQQLVLHASDEVYSLAFSHDSQTLAAGSKDVALLWRLDADGRPAEPIHLEHDSTFLYAITFGAEPYELLTAGEDTVVRVWNWQDGSLIQSLEHHSDAVYSIALSPEGTYVATGGYDKQVALWDPASWGYIDSRGFEARVSSIAFSADGKLLAIGTHDDAIVIWNLESNEVRPLGTHDSSVEAVAFSHRGHLLASAGLDKRVCLWDCDNFSRLWRLPGHEYLVKSVTFAADDKVVASASWDKTVRLWDVARPRLPRVISEESAKRAGRVWHEDWIWAVAVSNDGRILATGGSDQRVILWSNVFPQPAPGGLERA
ncbi:caspase family protein [Kribbella sp. NPDC050459]|uniref:caspase, EACC1-associated type n=1 Tax=Kribbella sp. NPDC050459 TaxID=3155785 RepID=UPI0033D6EAE9